MEFELMDYAIIIEPADDRSYSAYVPDLPGCISCGDSPGEVLDSIKEAIQGRIPTLREFNEPVPAPRSFASTVRAA